MFIWSSSDVLLLALALAGISETWYLVRKRRAMKAPACPIGRGCPVVLHSEYNRIFLGVYNDVAGFLFYLALAALILLRIFAGSELLWIGSAILLMLAGATLASVMLTYLEWRVIRAWCFWCLVSALTVLAMDIVALTAWSAYAG